MSKGALFSGIARRYDLLNSILSFGRDGAWRRSAALHLPPGRVLDLGAGTGAGNRAFADREVVALDPSQEMLEHNEAPARVVGVAEHLPFAPETFSGVFSAFVFRNLDSVPAALDEIERVLSPGGTAVIVDLGRPRNGAVRRLHRAGTAVLLPLAGAAVGARRQYRYLHETLDKHPPPEELLGGGPLRLDWTWHMGPLGFVWGAVLRKV